MPPTTDNIGSIIAHERLLQVAFPRKISSQQQKCQTLSQNYTMSFFFYISKHFSM
jgi:hypothetical protein